VGHVWVARREEPEGQDLGYVFDVEVREEHRGPEPSGPGHPHHVDLAHRQQPRKPGQHQQAGRESST
ncbi:hypothetical protein AB0L54_33785, partial [Streptomyces sp. NPDC052196]